MHGNFHVILKDKRSRSLGLIRKVWERTAEAGLFLTLSRRAKALFHPISPLLYTQVHLLKGKFCTDFFADMPTSGAIFFIIQKRHTRRN